MSVANIGKLQENTGHCAKWLRNSSGKRYQRIRICLTEEVETPSFPIRRQAPDVKYPENVERHPARIPNVGYPEKMERHPARIPDVGYPKKMERRKGDRLRVHGVGTHPEQLHPDSSSEHAALANITHPDDSISYPDLALVIIIPYSLHFGFAYGKGLQSFGSSCF